MFDDGRPRPRTRLSSLDFDPEHVQVAMFVSGALLMRLAKPAVTKFVEMCRIAGTRRPSEQRISVVKSNMFAPSKTKELRQWIVNHK